MSWALYMRPPLPSPTPGGPRTIRVPAVRRRSGAPAGGSDRGRPNSPRRRPVLVTARATLSSLTQQARERHDRPNRAGRGGPRAGRVGRVRHAYYALCAELETAGRGARRPSCASGPVRRAPCRADAGWPRAGVRGDPRALSRPAPALVPPAAWRPHLAEDALQETFLNAYRALRRGDEPRELRPWLHRIAYHAALDALRRRVRERGGPAGRGRRQRGPAPRARAPPEHQRSPGGGKGAARAAAGGHPLARARGSHVRGDRRRARGERGSGRPVLRRARAALREGATAVTPYELGLRLGIRSGHQPLSTRLAELCSEARPAASRRRAPWLSRSGSPLAAR